mmetsp:Transcript_43840/g.72420  ORF Transcript_43840/g.72420 Transcript_43840/m.72420 type:complete len:204 (+) Transcript_43840:37-648(+)
MTAPFDHLFKLVVVGDSGVGKSALIKRFVSGDFSGDYTATVGVDFGIKTLEVDGKMVKTQLWDTAGQERFRTIISSYYRGAHGVLLLYDITDPRTLQNAHKVWFPEIQQKSTDTTQVLLVGNKSDLNGQREVTLEEAEDIANELGIAVVETSVKDESNVEKAFYTIVTQILSTVRTTSDMGPHPVGMQLPVPSPSKSKCCQIL